MHLIGWPRLPIASVRLRQPRGVHCVCAAWGRAHCGAPLLTLRGAQCLGHLWPVVLGGGLSPSERASRVQAVQVLGTLPLFRLAVHAFFQGGSSRRVTLSLPWGLGCWCGAACLGRAGRGVGRHTGPGGHVLFLPCRCAPQKGGRSQPTPGTRPARPSARSSSRPASPRGHSQPRVSAASPAGLSRTPGSPASPSSHPRVSAACPSGHFRAQVSPADPGDRFWAQVSPVGPSSCPQPQISAAGLGVRSWLRPPGLGGHPWVPGSAAGPCAPPRPPAPSAGPCGPSRPPAPSAAPCGPCWPSGTTAAAPRGRAWPPVCTASPAGHLRDSGAGPSSPCRPTARTASPPSHPSCCVPAAGPAALSQASAAAPGRRCSPLASPEGPSWVSLVTRASISPSNWLRPQRSMGPPNLHCWAPDSRVNRSSRSWAQSRTASPRSHSWARAHPISPGRCSPSPSAPRFWGILPRPAGHSWGPCGFGGGPCWTWPWAAPAGPCGHDGLDPPPAQPARPRM